MKNLSAASLSACLIILTASILLSPVSGLQAQAPPIGYIGLYLDEARTQTEATSPSTFTLYVFCQPSENGMMCAEYSLAPSSGVYITGSTQNPGISVSLGDMVGGMSTCFLECQDDWIWTHSVEVTSTLPQAGWINIAAHPGVGSYSLATCLSGFPTEPCFISSRICINQPCLPDTESPVPIQVTTPDGEYLYLDFDEAIFEPDANDKTKYYVFNEDDPDDSIAVAWCVSFSPSGDLVRMRVETPLGGNVTYRMEVRGVRDVAGNVTPPGTSILFSGVDTIDPDLAGVAALSDSTVLVTFSEPVSEATGEQVSNYAIIPGGSTTPVVIASAERMPGGDSVLLTLPVYLEQNVTYTLTVYNITDLSGNFIDYSGPMTFRAVDVMPPYLLWLSVSSPYRLRLAFSEPVTTESMMDTANYKIFDTADPSTVFDIVEITRNAADKATLDINGPLQEEHPYSLTIVGIEDVSGLIIEPPGITTGFVLEDTSAPTMVSAAALDDSTVKVVFSELMDGVTSGDPSNYEIFETDYPIVTVPVVSATVVEPGDTVILGLGSGLPRGISFTARATGVYDYHENVIGFPNFAEFILADDSPPGLAGVYLVSQNSIQLQFDEPVSAATAGTIGNYTLFPTGSPGSTVPVSSVSLRADGIEATLTLQSYLSIGVEYTLQVSNVEDLSGNPIPPASEITFTALDERKPILVSLDVLDPQHIELTYNEPLDEPSATDVLNYKIYEKHTPTSTVAVTSATMPPDGTVILATGSDLLSGVPYILEISNVEDLAGNPILPGTKREFSYVSGDETGRIGLFADADRTANCVEDTVSFYQVNMWIWVRPGVSGMMCAEFSIDYPANVIQATVSDNPDMSVDLGNLDDGISVCLWNCAYDWVWLYRQLIFVTDFMPSIVAIEPHPYNEEVIFANCLEGHPIETGAVISSLSVNCLEAPPRLVSADNPDDTHVMVEFDRAVTPETSGIVSNYSLFETAPPGNVIPLVASVPQPDSTSAVLTTQVALTHQTNYTIRVSGVENLYGVPIVPESEIQFIATETEPPRLLSAVMTAQDRLELTFSEALDEASAENEPNYEVFRTLDPGSTVAVNVADLLPTGTVVRLFMLEPLADGVSYTVRATGVKDTAGNPIGDDNEAVLIAEDTYPPELVSALAVDPDRIILEFSEPLRESSAENTDNYSLVRAGDPGDEIPVVSGTLVGSSLTLMLGSDMAAWTDYTLAVSGLEDLAGNVIVPVSASIVLADGERSPSIALYLDQARSDYTIDAVPYQIFDVYIWCRPSSDGMMCAEYALLVNPAYGPFQCLEIGSELSPLVSVSLGDFSNGISTCMSDCHYDWTWISKVQYLYISGQGTIVVFPHPLVGAIQFASCLEGYPIVPAAAGTGIEVNIVSVATMLQNSSVAYADGAVTVAWTLLAGSDTPRFIVSRREAGPAATTGERFERLDGAGIEKNDLSFSFTDKTFIPGGSYEYRVSYDDDGTERTLFVSEAVNTPAMPLTLRQNKPNPFNPSTTISLFMPEPGNAVLEIFDVTGRRIALLHNGFLDRGEHSMDWQGSDSAGNRVSSGIYFYRLTTGKESISKKMVLMR